MAIVIANRSKLPKNCLDDCPCYNEESGCCQATTHWGLVRSPSVERADWCPLISVDLGGEF